MTESQAFQIIYFFLKHLFEQTIDFKTWYDQLLDGDRNLLRSAYQTFENNVPYWAHLGFVSCLKNQSQSDVFEFVNKRKYVFKPAIEQLMIEWQRLLENWRVYHANLREQAEKNEFEDVPLQESGQEPASSTPMAMLIIQRSNIYSIPRVKRCTDLVDLNELEQKESQMSRVAVDGLPINTL